MQFVNNPVNSENTFIFESNIISIIARLLEEKNKDGVKIINMLSPTIKSTSKLTIREYYILYDYNSKSYLDINIDKYSIFQLLDVFIMECMHHLYLDKYKKSNLKAFFEKKYKVDELIDIIKNNIIKFSDTYNWDNILKNIKAHNPSIKINKNIIDNLKIKYDKIYSYFTDDTFYNIFKKIINVNIKIYKAGQTLPNFNFEFNGIFTYSTKSILHKMGLYNFNEIYKEIINSKESDIIPKNIDDIANEEEILKKIKDTKKYILDKSIFPQDTSCEPVKVGKKNKIMFCPTTMEELLKHIETNNIQNSIFYLFGCSAQPIKKNTTPQVEKLIKLSRMMSELSQIDFKDMRHKVNTEFKENIIDDNGNITISNNTDEILDDENPLLDGDVFDDMRNKYLKYKMKYLRLKKLL